MTETTQLGLPLVQPAQAQKHVTVNEAFARLDALAQISLAGEGGVAPASPVDGALYAVAAGASGLWAGEDGRLALFLNGGWMFVTPKVGWRGWRADTGVAVAFDGADWIAGGGAFSANGAGFVQRSVEVDHSVGAGATSLVAGFIPANATVYGITGRVLADIGGAASFEVGVAGSSNRYGSGIGVSTGAWLRGITGNPLAYYSDTDVVLTATGGSFDGSGVVRLAVNFAELTLPRA
ncbi:MAG: DUF2793 domain-containing protein [Boseongicola sp.]|nr:DUF2793 domain-containing protein [Boseongicola sp.]